MMVTVIIALGSNTDRECRIEQAKEKLVALFGEGHVQFTQTVESEAIGIVSPAFGNCLCKAESNYPLAYLLHALKDIETACGNTEEKRLKDKIEMDIDLLKYDSRKFHVDDWERVYIKMLLKQLSETCGLHLH